MKKTNHVNLQDRHCSDSILVYVILLGNKKSLSEELKLISYHL